MKYTISRLPQLDKSGLELWKALHGFRPLSTDYAGVFEVPHIQRLSINPGITHITQAQCPFAASQSSGPQTALELVDRAFNWSSIHLPSDVEASWYGVVFRSKRTIGSESTNLYLADRLAHEEAVACGGLLMYFYGAPDPVTGMNLATCIWTSRAEARTASNLPLHKKAAAHAEKAYEAFELSRYRVVKDAGQTALRVEAWEDGDD